MISQEIQKFIFSETEIRIILTPTGEIYFVASDVCKVLELANTAQAISRLDEDEKTTIILNEYGRDYEKPIITESGLYSLVLGSKKPEAKAFKKWVTRDVLPAIRKTGKYEMPQEQSQQADEDFDEDGNALTMEAATQKLDYEILAAQNFLNLIDKCIDDKLAHFKRKDLNDGLTRVLFEQKNMKIEIMQYIGLLANRLHINLPSPTPDKPKPFVSYVYLMEKTDDTALILGKHKCKVGKSNNTQKRKFQLEAGGAPLEVIEEICFNTESEALLWEKAIKALFAPYLIDREWYLLEDRHLEFFCALARIIEVVNI